MCYAALAGQNRQNPASIFGTHYLAQINGTSYDVGPGITHSDVDAFQATAVDGFMSVGSLSIAEADVDVDLNGDGDKADTVPTDVILFRKAGKIPETTISPYETY